MPAPLLKIAIVGAGPVGLVFALRAATALPWAQVSVFDARAQEASTAGDPRALALSLGSVQALEALGVWRTLSAAYAESAIREVHVSHSGAQWRMVSGRSGEDDSLVLRAADHGVAQLGTVVRYGGLTDALQRAWLLHAARNPARACPRFATRVINIKPGHKAVELDTGICEQFDAVVIAEGGLYGDASQTEDATSTRLKSYRQQALVGEVLLETHRRHIAFECFTAEGPLALLPLPRLSTDPASCTRASLVWCISGGDDSIPSASPEDQLKILRRLIPSEAGSLRELSELRRFELGLRAPKLSAHYEACIGDPAGRRDFGRIARIGNARQTLHPVAGQGFNLGLRDAQGLVASMRSHMQVPQATRAFEQQRVPDGQFTVMATDLLARAFTWPGLASSMLRAAGFGVLNSTPTARSALASSMMFGIWR